MGSIAQEEEKSFTVKKSCIDEWIIIKPSPSFSERLQTSVFLCLGTLIKIPLGFFGWKTDSIILLSEALIFHVSHQRILFGYFEIISVSNLACTLPTESLS